MYAIAKSGGKQFKIEQNSTIRVPSLKAGVGEKVRLDSILLLSRDNGVAVGTPFVEGAYAEARVVRHGRGRKIRIIKYKRRKNYHRTIGHRQDFTELVIDSIVESGGTATAEKKTAKKAAPPAVEPETDAVAESPVEEPVVQTEQPESGAETAEAPAVEKKKTVRKTASKSETVAKAEDEKPEAASAGDSTTGEEEAKPKRSRRKSAAESDGEAGETAE